MIVQFRTQNGTIYELDSKQMTWRKVKLTNLSGETRANSGKLLSWPIIEIGKEALLHDSEVLPGCTEHYIQTSEVVSLEENL